MIITDNDDEEVNNFQVKLSKDLGEHHHFLGLYVETVKDDIFISQVDYAKKITERFDLKEQEVHED